MASDHVATPAVRALMARAGVVEADLEETFARSSGPGGQKVNKTSSAVWLTHRPSGVKIRCDSSRSQATNRLLARRRLAERLLLRQEAGQREEAARLAKVRRQKARRGRRARAKVLADKRHVAQQKAARRPAKDGDD